MDWYIHAHFNTSTTKTVGGVIELFEHYFLIQPNTVSLLDGDSFKFCLFEENSSLERLCRLFKKLIISKSMAFCHSILTFSKMNFSEHFYNLLHSYLILFKIQIVYIVFSEQAWIVNKKI